jgi:hypothetical protein
MKIEISPLDRSQIKRRTKDGQIFDVIDYPFQLSNGNEKCTINVGITGMFHDPAEAVGSRRLSQEELVQAAGEWLRRAITEGQYDPFKPDSPFSVVIPSPVLEYWAQYREFPD